MSDCSEDESNSIPYYRLAKRSRTVNNKYNNNLRYRLALNHQAFDAALLCELKSFFLEETRQLYDELCQGLSSSWVSESVETSLTRKTLQMKELEKKWNQLSTEQLTNRDYSYMCWFLMLKSSVGNTVMKLNINYSYFGWIDSMCLAKNVRLYDRKMTPEKYYFYLNLLLRHNLLRESHNLTEHYLYYNSVFDLPVLYRFQIINTYLYPVVLSDYLSDHELQYNSYLMGKMFVNADVTNSEEESNIRSLLTNTFANKQSIFLDTWSLKGPTIFDFKFNINKLQLENFRILLTNNYNVSTVLGHTSNTNESLYRIFILYVWTKANWERIHPNLWNYCFWYLCVKQQYFHAVLLLTAYDPYNIVFKKDKLKLPEELKCSIHNSQVLCTIKRLELLLNSQHAVNNDRVFNYFNKSDANRSVKPTNKFLFQMLIWFTLVKVRTNIKADCYFPLAIRNPPSKDKNQTNVPSLSFLCYGLLSKKQKAYINKTLDMPCTVRHRENNRNIKKNIAIGKIMNEQILKIYFKTFEERFHYFTSIYKYYLQEMFKNINIFPYSTADSEEETFIF